MKVYKANNKKSKFSAIAVCLLLTAMLAISGTLAYLFTQSDAVVNTFKPVNPEIIVDEPEWEGEVKSNVTIKNTGDVDSYIRAKITVNWQNGNDVYPVDPVEGADYFIEWDLTDWFMGDDGFYYYKKSVEANGGKTGVLIKEAKWLQPCAGNTETVEYKLNIEIISQSVQSTPKNAVESVWPVTVDADGNLTKA